MEMELQIQIQMRVGTEAPPRKEAQERKPEEASRMHANCSRGAENILGIYSFLLFTDRKCNSQIVSSTSGEGFGKSKRKALTH